MRRLLDTGPVPALLHGRPLAAACLAWLAGAAAWVIPVHLGWPDLWAVSALFILVASGALAGFSGPAPDRIPARLAWNATLLLTLSLAGLVYAARAAEIPVKDVSRLASAHLIRLIGAADAAPHATPSGRVFPMDCSEAWCGAEAYRVTGQVEVWVPGAYFGKPPPVEYVRWPREAQPVEVIGVLSALQPGSSPWGDALLRQGMAAVIKVGKGGVVRPIGRPDPTVHTLCLRVEDWMLDGLRTRLPESDVTTLAGMLFHRKDGMDPDALKDLQNTGTIHIVATAGLHVGIFLAVCLLGFGAVLPRRTAVILTMLILPGYCIGCGGWPAVFRATLMAELALAAWLAGRLPDGVTIFTLAAVVLVIRSPMEFLDPGFQFTFLTVSVIMLMLPLMETEQDPGLRPASKAHKVLREVLTLSVGAQLGSLALTAYCFGVISPIGVVANLLIVPLLMAIIPLAFWVGIMAHAIPVLAGPGAGWLHEIINLLLWLAHTLARVPGAAIQTPNVPWPAVALYYLVLGAGLGWVRLYDSGTGGRKEE